MKSQNDEILSIQAYCPQFNGDVAFKTYSELEGTEDIEFNRNRADELRTSQSRKYVNKSAYKSKLERAIRDCRPSPELVLCGVCVLACYVVTHY